MKLASTQVSRGNRKGGALSWDSAERSTACGEATSARLRLHQVDAVPIQFHREERPDAYCVNRAMDNIIVCGGLFALKECNTFCPNESSAVCG